MADRDITTLLADWRRGDRGALDQLTPIVYNELRRLAASYMRSERVDHTLQSTALVHEAYLRLAGGVDIDWENRSHFFGIAAQIVRRILVDHARAANTAKRGSGAVLLSINEEVNSAGGRAPELLELDGALNALAAIDPRQARVVELRFFAGLNVDETAEVMSISRATVKREWAAAKAWLYRELGRASAT
ncbi:MAG: sigma-70 family RNA polymerase sigma factor [Bryobacteraceae bacterium]